ncbi:VOC family protein [Ectobacillus ponti]|uniref:VOC family protein n=1 Tax=Ectobacillus ponti TaxID=2961894 RepID=A0AA42BPU0_9BACI|nr:VOC family protein [Ectobacillus ponti]MCP8969117.1 VOC family protein [Ectobacillus ponti]
MQFFIGLDHVQLAAPSGCEEQARQFYGELLGMPEVPKPANLLKRGGCWFRCGGQEIHIGVQEDFRAAKKAHPAFRVHDLEAFKQHVAERGVTVKEDEPLPGAIRFYIDDPFGNRLEFLQRL